MTAKESTTFTLTMNEIRTFITSSTAWTVSLTMALNAGILKRPEDRERLCGSYRTVAWNKCVRYITGPRAINRSRRFPLSRIDIHLREGLWLYSVPNLLAISPPHNPWSVYQRQCLATYYAGCLFRVLGFE